jgi:hypothetical protein
MALINIPQAGQPIDLEYIARIANAVNTLSENISVSNNRRVTVDDLNNGPRNVKFSDAKIIAGLVSVTKSSETQVEQTFTYTYSGFSTPPVVTASALNSSLSSTGNDVSVVLTNITAGSVTGVVRFNSSGLNSVNVNLIIIGIPS